MTKSTAIPRGQKADRLRLTLRLPEPLRRNRRSLQDRQVIVEGFAFGKITDFEAEPSQEGDAFVVAPDNSRAGLVWEIADNVSVSQISPLEPSRWGVWAVSSPNE